MTDIEFVEALSANQARLRAYAISIVQNPVDADDLLQNASLTLWNKKSQYDSSRDFFPWACGFLLIEIMRHRRKISADKLLFDEAMIQTLSAEYVANVGDFDIRREYLHKCLKKLGDKERTLLEDRYSSNIAPKNISKLRGLPLPTVYGTLSRIRTTLHRCIETSIAQRS